MLMDITNMKTIIAVILYNTQIDDSETIKQLAVNVCDNCILIIVNNGPKKINKNSAVLDILVREYIGVEIREYIENKPLSWIYNEVLNGFDSDRYVGDAANLLI
uniref:Glycosyl transferase n=1 Tax=Klebsiella sp. 6177 TaxID=1497816 RepID=A0A0P0YRA2_9ENTR|nr:glycosyl transferase [Klebsiella sp. 6177]